MERSRLNEIAEAAAGLGYAAGVLEGVMLADCLSDNQRVAIHRAVEKIEAIDILKLTASEKDSAAK